MKARREAEATGSRQVPGDTAIQAPLFSGR
ncbi:hypothetical protein PAP18089_00645 [Pandoraea apista]|uniref:Uncharacterized protein n=1 Tax=Pandoraea apista TaxID=93218 RepID=A0A5E5NZF9_9BURK|nr:hypothetical protein LMG16407_02277 [Pandoraea apista]VVG69688.1 hypothetical protein PAP18089_00645 [Pandoraea apista]